MYSIKIIEGFPSAKKNVENITSEELQKDINSLTIYSDSTINKVIGQLNQGFSHCFNNSYIVKNPMANILKPKSKKKTRTLRALTIEEQERFTNYLQNAPLYREPFKLAYLIEMYLGLRIGETLALSKSDIDLLSDIININHTLTINKKGQIILEDTTKTYSGERELYIPYFLKDDFARQLKIAENNPKNLLFVDTKGGYMNPKNANRHLKNILNAMGIEDVSTHTLRHTYATRCVEAEMTDVALKDFMGHKDIGITKNIYTSVLGKYKRSEADKVNNYYVDNNIIHNTNNNCHLRLLKGNKKDDMEEIEIG